jgi:hypothetical protein
MDPMSDREIDFRLDIHLMIVRNACGAAAASTSWTDR